MSETILRKKIINSLSNTIYPQTDEESVLCNNGTISLKDKLEDLDDSLENLDDKLNKIPSGYYYGQFENVVSLPDVSTLESKGYAYVASTDPAVYYIYLFEGTGSNWENSGNKFVTTKLETNLATKSQTKAPTTKAVADGIEIVNLIDTKSTPLTVAQKYNASANINDRPADVAPITGIVNALGYKVLNPNASFASQIIEPNTIYELKDNFTVDTEIEVPTNITIRYNGGSITGSGHVFSNDDTLKIEGLKSNNGIYSKGYNFQTEDSFLVASQIGMMSGSFNGMLNATILNKVVSHNKNITLDGDYYFERYNNAPFSIGYDFTIQGGTARFIAGVTSAFFTITSGGGITFDGVEFYNSAKHYFIRMSNIDYVFDKICFYNCVFNNRTAYIYITAPDVDYGETPFGCKKVIVDGCEFRDAGTSFLLLDAVVSEEFKVVNNNVNFVGTFVNIGQTNGRTYNESNKLYWCDVVFDNNIFSGRVHETSPGEYYTPIVAETNRVFYTNNIIKNLIAIDSYPAYECYLSANYVVISGNNITDVMSLKHKHTVGDGFAFSETGKAKGSHFLAIKNNYWNVDANRVRQLCNDAGITFNDSIRIKKMEAAESVPEFELDTYYSYTIEYYYPKLLTEQPSNWNTAYTSYYKVVEEDGIVVNEWDCTAKYEKFRPNYGYKLLFFENNEVHLKNLIYGEASTIAYSKNVELHINKNLFDLTRTNDILIGIYGIYSDDANEEKIFEFVGNTINLENDNQFAPCTPLYFAAGKPNKVNCNALIANNISNVNLLPASLVTKSVFKNNIVTPIQLNQNGYIYDSDITDIDINWTSATAGSLVYFYPAKINVIYTPNEIYGFISYVYKNRILHFVCNKLGLDIKIIMVVDGNNISIYNIFGKLIGQYTKSNLNFYIWYLDNYTAIRLANLNTDLFMVRLSKARYDFGEVEIDSDTFDVTKFNISNSDIKYQSNGTYGIFEGYDKYVDFNGRTSAKTSGTSAERPTSSMLSTDVGFMYYDTDLDKPIYWNGVAWTDSNSETIGLQVRDTSILIGAAADSKTVLVYYGGTTAPTIAVLNADDTANTWLTATYTLYAPTFVANTYYSAANTQVATKPSNWETNYMDYFTDAEATIPVAGVPKNEVVLTASANDTSAPRGAKVLVTLGDELIIINVVQSY